jgi:CO dehydrogenase/acetyl-CoA synthase delta subunit
MNLRTRMKRWSQRTVLIVVATAALAYGLDYAILRLRVAANWTPYSSVTVNHYTAVPQKNGKTNLTFDPPAPWTCANALFPHGGMMPCWYLKRHPDQRTDM